MNNENKFPLPDCLFLIAKILSNFCEKELNKLTSTELENFYEIGFKLESSTELENSNKKNPVIQLEIPEFEIENSYEINLKPTTSSYNSSNLLSKLLKGLGIQEMKLKIHK
ncbi:11965_t:CDS:2 [Gigaspora margarita]|uniref:11965_t:CDS:1 n=1 Tax=Gigaspora margarita TaxID=4874 RepID=A0ABN7UXF0_GIGMA|nr:11965_t:CDS:2 [Gigaspora margarita]